jgi:hypothetical protein
VTVPRNKKPECWRYAVDAAGKNPRRIPVKKHTDRGDGVCYVCKKVIA